MGTKSDANTVCEKNARSRTRKIYAITARVSPEEKRQFALLAAGEGIPSSAALRKLIRSVLKEDLSLFDVFKKNSGRTSIGRAEIKTRLTEKEKQAFFSLSREWDIMPGTLVRFIVKFFIQTQTAEEA
jgi:hypothetical protein